MTDQTKFKQDTTELHSLLKAYKRNYDFMSGSRDEKTPIEGCIKHLRRALDIVRTDEENSQQRKVDCYC